MNVERLKHMKDLQIYWQEEINEYYEKENLIPKTKSQSINTTAKDHSVVSQLQKQNRPDESKNDYYMKIANDVFLFAVAYEDLIKGDISNFIKLLKTRLSARSRMSLSSANEPVLQAIVELFLPLKYYIPELCLIMNNTKKKGNGRYGFVDMFVLGKEIEKNYVTELEIII
ncbi:hypothetical protein RclHR1_15530007 [Rhizophagus clarus]|uniref:Uncharacterized protein n=1 Tax=Rhizophagus clarus TaxID=94130 RepID=A0A2Z6QFK3_9GLOM|nr:hypothetical protein RclHR1_15530007 [Rhizophagus clarus]GES87652.1 hypothetical protein GLOIN_2v1790294 [Rhizophagus clarus]